MKSLAICALLAAFSFGASTIQDMPAPAEPTAEHKWLQQLVGDWECNAECSMGPDAEPMKMESTEKVQALGGLWVVLEGSADFAGTPFSSMMTLGYDPQEKAVVGTYVDTMQTHLWTYRGTFDKAKKTLTLEADGPHFEDPEKTCRFRDAITIVDADHKVLTSTIQGDDGEWTEIMRAEYRRKK